MDDLWTATHRARQHLADDLTSIGEEDWRHATLCEGWDVEHVVAHLTAAASTGPAAWMRSIVLSGFRPAVHNQRRLREHLGATPQETLDRFRAVTTSTVAPSKDTAAYLGEVVVHGEDIRRPLGRVGPADVAATTAVAEFFAERDFTVQSKTVAAGLSLRATDGPFRAGTGPEVAGPTLALVMSMAGRTSHLDQLTGPGLAQLTGRLERPSRAKGTRADVWDAVHEERRRLVRDLEGLRPKQWDVPSQCRGWSVHDVLAHLIDSATTTRLGFARQMVTARFDFDRANDDGVRRHRAADPRDTLARFRGAVDSTHTPPGPVATRLVEAYVHGEDIRRPLGTRGSYPVENVLEALRYQARTASGFGGGKDRVRGLRLRPDDIDVSIGEGPEVRGSAVALLLAVSGRPVDPDELRGEGAPTLLARA